MEDNRKIAFIICADDAQYYNECTRYIQDIYVPEGYETELLCIQEADSIAQGYQAAMRSVHAKYKVYLRQDVFIRNRNFIGDCLRIFENSQIGMIGMIGAAEVRLDEDGYWKWDAGRIEEYDGRCTYDKNPGVQCGENYMPVQIVDGALLVTQYDVAWREDILEGWQLCGVSQAAEMAARGYLTVVPSQENAWCYRGGGLHMPEIYAQNYGRIRAEYAHIGLPEQTKDSAQSYKSACMMGKELRELCIRVLTYGGFEEIETAISRVSDRWMPDIELREMANLMEIYKLEEESVSKRHSAWFDGGGWEQLYDRYKQCMFAIRRLEWGRRDARIDMLRGALESGKLSRDAIRKISGIALTDTVESNRQLFKKKEEPLVSVVMAVYNGEAFVRETFESVLQQTYTKLEIIVVDDASTDVSKSIIREYAQADERVKPVFSEKNRNICHAGNLAFAKAQGKYIALMGHDDLWKPDKIEKQVQFLEEHPSYSVCFTWADIIDEDGVIQNEKWEVIYHRFCADNYKRKQWIKKLVLEKNYFCAPSACVRRESLVRTGYYRFALVQLQDFDLWLRLLLQGNVYVLQEKLTRYRRFRNANKNLSYMDNDTETRAWHENHWIIYRIITDMEAELFANVFQSELKNPQAVTVEEIRCEKAFFLWEQQNCFAELLFIELLESEEIRDMLENKYQFTLNDFYKMNTQAMHFDASLLLMVKQQQQLIEEYRKESE